MKSIKTKFALILGILLFVVCLGLSSVAYVTSTRALSTVAEELSIKTATESAKVVEERIQARLGQLLTIANTDIIANPDISMEEKMEYIKKEVERGDYLSIALGDVNGAAVTMAGVWIDLKERPYYQEALKGNPAVTDPIISREDNVSLIVNYAVPITDDSGKVTGVLVGARHGDELSSITNDIQLGLTGRAFMVNREGLTVAHYDQEAVRRGENILDMAADDTSLTDHEGIFKRVVTGEAGFGEYHDEGIDKYIAYAPVDHTNWVLTIEVPKEEILSSLTTLKGGVLISSTLFLLIGLIIIYFITGFFARQIKAIADHLNVIAKGDFGTNQIIELGSRRDEIADAYRSMFLMQESVRVMISSIKDVSEEVNKHSENLNNVSNQMYATSESVSMAIQDTAQGVSSQAEALASINETLYTFGERLDSIVKDIQDIDASSQEINDMSNRGNEDMQLLIESVNLMGAAFRDFTDKIGGLSQNINQVTEITNLINSIAEQTNLLALNAAIEAARAGEAGKGFAVVADEIRNLAEQSKHSSHKINDLIVNITGDAEMIIQNTDGLNQELNTQANVINGAIESYGKIVKAIQEIGAKIQSANRASIDINNEKSTILARVEDASAVAQEVSASSEEISAATEQMAASSEEVSASAGEMNTLVGNMLEQVNRFRI